MMQNIRTFRAPVTTLGMRQRVVSRRQEPMSRDLVRAIAIVVVMAVMAVGCISQFIHWRYESDLETLAQLQSVRKTMGTENINVLAARARLLSKSHVEAVAAARLQLFRPEDGQLHHL